jgi:hypothetical protein
MIGAGLLVGYVFFFLVAKPPRHLAESYSDAEHVRFCAQSGHP